MYKNFSRKTIFRDRDAAKFWHYYISQKQLCAAMRQRIITKLDNTVLVTGITGCGKSTIIGKLCFNHFANMDNVKVEGEKMYNDDNFMIDPETYASKMITDKGNVLWDDEFRDAASSRSWNSQINKTIISRKNKNRKRGITSFLLMPYEIEVDKSFLKHITMWIYVKRRGIAEIYVANNSRKGGQGLSVQRIIDREAKWFKENPKRRVADTIIHPEYIGSVIFSSFSKAEDKRYEALVKKHHASGKLTDEEEERLNPIADTKELEKQIPLVLDEVEAGTVKSKREMWDKLKKATGFDDALLIRHINRHLKIRGFKNFNSFEI